MLILLFNFKPPNNCFGFFFLVYSHGRTWPYQPLSWLHSPPHPLLLGRRRRHQNQRFIKKMEWVMEICSGLVLLQPSRFTTCLWPRCLSMCTTLDLYSSSVKLIKFLIDFEYTGRYFFYVDKWVRFATTHNVENLYLEFYATKTKKPNTSDSTSYLLPLSLSTNSMLKMLSLTFCSFETITTISWTSLKVLWIGYATLTHDMIHNILLGSPALTELRLHNFEIEGNEVVINSTRLKKLELEGDKDPAINDFTIVEISAPNLQSLSISGFIYYTKFELTNVSSLIEARLSFERKSTYNGRLFCHLNELSDNVNCNLKFSCN